MEVNLVKKEKEQSKNLSNITYLKDLSQNSYSQELLDNIFTVFKSINNDIIYLVYANIEKSIIYYNLVNFHIINEIKNAHKMNISNIRYFLDKANKRELILSVSAQDCNIKIWDINNWKYLLNIGKIYDEGFLYSACCLKDNNEIYIATSHNSRKCSEYIKIYNLNGNKQKEIYESDDQTFFIDSFYDTKLSKNFIITGNFEYVKSFDYKNNRLYFEFCDKQNCRSAHTSLIVDKKDGIIRLIESSVAGYIRIWNFHTGILLNRISSNKRIRCICLWNDEYLFVGMNQGMIKLLELNSQKFIKEFQIYSPFNNDEVLNFNGNFGNHILTIKKIIHPTYGECLICQGNDKNQIKIYINKV